MDSKDATLTADRAEALDQLFEEVERSRPANAENICPKCRGRKFDFETICSACQTVESWHEKDRREARGRRRRKW